jgi:hypothetical protein
MLVQCKNPHGMITIRGRRVYGAAMVQPPADIPYEHYDANRYCLESATYREGDLARIFGHPFPMMAFKYHEIRYIPEAMLDRILDCMHYEYDRDWPRKQKIELIKRALRDAPTA